MGRTTESPEYKAENTGSIIQEYSERIMQALHIEAENLKKRAELDSDQIKNRAKDESDAIIGAAREEARQIVSSARQRVEECTGVVVETQKETEQLLIEVDKLVAQVRQKIEVDLVDIITRLKQETEKFSQESPSHVPAAIAQVPVAPAGESPVKMPPIVKEVINREDDKEKDELAESLEETRNRLLQGTAQLIPRMAKEARPVSEEEPAEDIPAGFDRLTSVAAEAEKKWQMLTETLGIEAAGSSPQRTEKKITAVSYTNKTEVTVHSIEEKQSIPVIKENPVVKETPASKENLASRAYKGALKLEIVPPIDPLKLKAVQEQLGRIPDLKVLSTGGYIRKDEWVATYIVDLKKKMPILESLRAIPSVRDAAEQDGKIIVTIK